MTTTMGPIKVADTGLSAQDIISLPKVPIRYGVLRRKNPTITFGKWPHRFIVLLRDSIYVYHDEKSKAPSSSFSLLGYNRVKRVTSKRHEWCFAVVPDPTQSSMKPEKFACVSDPERREWMIAVRNQMYPANNITCIPLRPSSFTEELDYQNIEEPVYDPRQKEEPEAIDSTSEDESSSDSEFEEKIPVSRKSSRSRSHSVPQILTPEEVEKLKMKARNYSDAGQLTNLREEEEGDAPNWKHGGSLKVSRAFCDPPRYSDIIDGQENDGDAEDDEQPDYINLSKMAEYLQRGGDDPLDQMSPQETWEDYDFPPEIPSSRPGYPNAAEENGENDNDEFDQYEVPQIPPMPTRRQSIPMPPEVKEEEEEDESSEDVYVVPSTDTIANLESLCTVVDNNMDRDIMICLLQAKKVSGTYFIRKSRECDLKVLAYLTHNGHVKEYKIYAQGSKVYMERHVMFETVEALLRHYTHVSPLPLSNHYLKFGFNAVG